MALLIKLLHVGSSRLQVLTNKLGNKIFTLEYVLIFLINYINAEGIALHIGWEVFGLRDKAPD